MTADADIVALKEKPRCAANRVTKRDSKTSYGSEGENRRPGIRDRRVIMRSNCCFAVCAICLIAVSVLLPHPALAEGTSGASYTAEQISSTSAEVFLDRMLNQEPGYWQFAALNALIQKAKDADAAGRQHIHSLVVTVMKDKTRAIYQRWQCCYVISGSRDEPGVPDLIDVLLRDESEVVRSVAAEALGKLSDIKAAHDALMQAARTEASARVREVLAKYLGKDMPALEPSPMPPPVSVVVPSPAPPAHVRLVGPSPAQRRSAEALLHQIWQAQPGKPKFDAINAVVRSLGDMDAADRNAILSLFVAAMKDRGMTITQRWPCCYVISRSAFEPGVPHLIQELLGDESETMRAVAAEALGGLRDNPPVRGAMMESARHERSKWVRETLAKYLGDAMPDLEPDVPPSTVYTSPPR